MRYQYPFVVHWRWFEYRALDIHSNINYPTFWHEMYIKVPAIEIEFFFDWLDKPIPSSYPGDSDYDEIPW